jgi:hypothetical protein
MNLNLINRRNNPVGNLSGIQHPAGSRSNQWNGASVGFQRLGTTVSVPQGGLVAAARAHSPAISIGSIRCDSSDDEIESPGDYEDEEKERFTIPMRSQVQGLVAVTLDDDDDTVLPPERFTIPMRSQVPGLEAVTLDDDDDTVCVCHPRVYALKKDTSCLKHYQDEVRPKPTKNKRVRWDRSLALERKEGSNTFGKCLTAGI